MMPATLRAQDVSSSRASPNPAEKVRNAPPWRSLAANAVIKLLSTPPDR